MNGSQHPPAGSYPGAQQSSYSPAPYVSPSAHPPSPERAPRRDLFGLLDGIPANLMIVFGLFFLLIGLTIPGCRQAYASSVEADWRLASALMDHDLTQFREAQEREREQERQQILANPTAPPDVSANETHRQAQLTAEQQRLERAHDVSAKRREALEAAASVQGLWGYRWVEWLGRLLLLLGLIVITSQAQGTRQKVFLVLTAIVLLTSLRGIDLDVDLGTRVGTRQDSSATEGSGALNGLGQ